MVPQNTRRNFRYNMKYNYLFQAPSRARAHFNSRQLNMKTYSEKSKKKRNNSKQRNNTRTLIYADDKDVFPVERVLKRRGRKGHYKYLLKWEGYPSTFNSWEPEKNLTVDLIQGYESSLTKKSKKRKTDVKWYSVERILDCRVNENGKTMYYIKWEGYPQYENSWEPEEFVDCPGLVEEFQTSLQNARNE